MVANTAALHHCQVNTLEKLDDIGGKYDVYDGNKGLSGINGGHVTSGEMRVNEKVVDGADSGEVLATRYDTAQQQVNNHVPMT
jgi:hypothetical protein